MLLFFVSCAESESAEDIVVSTSTTTTINQFQTLSEYGYVLQELNGTYCISLPSYQVEPLQCFEDELEAIKDWNFRIDLEKVIKKWLLFFQNISRQQLTKYFRVLFKVIMPIIASKENKRITK